MSSMISLKVRQSLLKQTKPRRALALFLTAAIAMSPSLSRANGPGDGGGGGIQTKTRAEISLSVAQLRLRLANAFHRFDVFHSLVKYTEDERGVEVPNGGTPPAVLGLIADGKIQDIISAVKIVTQDGPCKDPMTNEDRDASLSNLAMCISINRLALWPSASFERELLAVGAHEISHARGYNETQAKAVYQEFLDSEILKFDVKPIEDRFNHLHYFAVSALSSVYASTGAHKAWTPYQRHLAISPSSRSPT